MWWWSAAKIRPPRPRWILFRGGAHVTLVHRGAEVGKSLKYWVKPDIENRIRAGEIKAMFQRGSDAHRAAAGVGANEFGPEKAIPAEQVFPMTGYHPDFGFLQQQGIRLDRVTKRRK